MSLKQKDYDDGPLEQDIDKKTRGGANLRGRGKATSKQQYRVKQDLIESEDSIKTLQESEDEIKVRTVTNKHST